MFDVTMVLIVHTANQFNQSARFLYSYLGNINCRIAFVIQLPAREDRSSSEKFFFISISATDRIILAEVSMFEINILVVQILLRFIQKFKCYAV